MTTQAEERQRWLRAIRARLDAHEERLAGVMVPSDLEPSRRLAIIERVHGAASELRSLLSEMGVSDG